MGCLQGAKRVKSSERRRGMIMSRSTVASERDLQVENGALRLGGEGLSGGVPAWGRSISVGA